MREDATPARVDGSPTARRTRTSCRTWRRGVALSAKQAECDALRAEVAALRARLTFPVPDLLKMRPQTADLGPSLLRAVEQSSVGRPATRRTRKRSRTAPEATGGDADSAPVAKVDTAVLNAVFRVSRPKCFFAASGTAPSTPPPPQQGLHAGALVFFPGRWQKRLQWAEGRPAWPAPLLWSVRTLEPPGLRLEPVERPNAAPSVAELLFAPADTDRDAEVKFWDCVESFEDSQAQGASDAERPRTVAKASKSQNRKNVPTAKQRAAARRKEDVLSGFRREHREKRLSKGKKDERDRARERLLATRTGKRPAMSSSSSAGPAGVSPSGSTLFSFHSGFEREHDEESDDENSEHDENSDQEHQNSSEYEGCGGLSDDDYGHESDYYDDL